MICHELSKLSISIAALHYGSRMDELRVRAGCQFSIYALDEIRAGKDYYLSGRYCDLAAHSDPFRMGYEQERRDFNMGVVR